MSEWKNASKLSTDARPSAAGCLTVLGVFLLLPGGCSLILLVQFLLEGARLGQNGGFFVIIWVISFALSAIGILMIRAARKKRGRA